MDAASPSPSRRRDCDRFNPFDFVRLLSFRLRMRLFHQRMARSAPGFPSLLPYRKNGFCPLRGVVCVYSIFLVVPILLPLASTLLSNRLSRLASAMSSFDAVAYTSHYLQCFHFDCRLSHQAATSSLTATHVDA